MLDDVMVDRFEDFDQKMNDSIEGFLRGPRCSMDSRKSTKKFSAGLEEFDQKIFGR